VKLLFAKPNALEVFAFGTGCGFISTFFDLVVLFAGEGQAPAASHPRGHRICCPQKFPEKFSPLWRGKVLIILKVRRQFKFFEVR
jgi:hypothetical protein